MDLVKKTANALEGLDALRQRINTIDSQIVALLEQRAAVSLGIGKTKQIKKGGCSYVPSRERDVFARLGEDIAEPLLTRHQRELVYREIISVSRNLQQQEHIALWGDHVELVAREHFGGASCFHVHAKIEAAVSALVTYGCCLGAFSAAFLDLDCAWNLLQQMQSEGIVLVNSLGDVNWYAKTTKIPVGTTSEPLVPPVLCFSRETFDVRGPAVYAFAVEIASNDTSVLKNWLNGQPDNLCYALSKEDAPGLSRYVVLVPQNAPVETYTWASLEDFLAPARAFCEEILPLGVLPYAKP